MTSDTPWFPLVTNQLPPLSTFCVSGTARSGTTAFAILMGTAECAEYVNEPHTMAHVMLEYVRGEVSEQSAREILGTYLFWGELVPALTGRGINTNPHDQSYAGYWLGEDEVRSRTSRSWRFRSIARRIEMANLIVKFVDQMIPILGARTLWTTNPLVLTLRHPANVAASCKARGYYERPGIDVNQQPFVRYIEGNAIPTFVPEDLVNIWLGGTWDDRSFIGSIAFLRALDQCRDAWLIPYAGVTLELISDLFEALALRPGVMTNECLAAFTPERDSSLSLQGLSPRPSILEECQDLWAKWSSRTGDTLLFVD